jgi:ATP-dependent Clp protease ATP-binding subunit ClpX
MSSLINTQSLDTEILKQVLPNPIDIVSKLDEYIIGQKDAKKTLALMLLNRAIKKLHRHGIIKIDTKLDKSNVLLIGPTGCGKTALIRALGLISGMDILVADITSITSAGYVGNKVEDILHHHVVKCEKFLNTFKLDTSVWPEHVTKKEMLKEIVETGIIYIDEIDKARVTMSYKGRDVNGMAVQSELLKIVEDGEVTLSNASVREAFYKGREAPPEGINITSVTTNDIIFICGGAFSGLDEIIAKRLSKTNSMGFSGNVTNTHKLKSTGDIFKYVNSEDLIEYGIIPELLGRLPLRSVLHPLDLDIMKRVILEPKDAVYFQYKEVFRLFNIDLEIESDALTAIAELAISLKTGARSLKAIFAGILQERLFNVFNITDNKLMITKDIVCNYGSKNNEI